MNAPARLDYAKDRKHGRVTVPRGVRVRKLRATKGLKVFIVDGERIRRDIDVDFVLGGNPARYGYIPEGEIWLDRNLSRLDRHATLAHEVIECKLMMKGMSYDEAHDIASAAEQKLRQRL